MRTGEVHSECRLSAGLGRGGQGLAKEVRAKKKSKPLNLKIHSSVGSCENIPSQQRSPLLSERSLRSFFVGHAPFLPSTPPVHTEANFSASV
ncbi:hypothetical protein CB1_000390008 [Camelus ferus]|nr:hypothetical protein CB1_000390008 [Camelus ferus]